MNEAVRSSGTKALRLPVGQLDDGGERVRLRVARGSKVAANLRAFLLRTRGLRDPTFVVPESIEEEDDALVLVYAAERSGTVSAWQAGGAWRRGLAVALPTILDLAAFVAEARVRVATSVTLMPVSCPRVVRFTPGDSKPWKLLALPAFGNTVSEWARGDPAAWTWLSPEVALGAGPGTVGYVVGAALYECIVGDPFPEFASARECFARILRGHFGSPLRLAASIEGSLPRGLAEEGRGLSRAILGLLATGTSELTDNPGQLVESLRDSFSTSRVAQAWIAEGQAHVALELLSFQAESSAPERVPWELLAQLKTQAGDEDGALRAVTRLVESGAVAGPRLIRFALRWMARSGSSSRDVVGRVINAMDTCPAELDDTDRLYLAHLEARYLGRMQAARRRLESPFHGRWAESVRTLILARIHAEAADYAAVGKLVREGTLAAAAMPDGGGRTGSYQRAYLAVLEGIANFGAVAAFQKTYFFADAFKAFTAALGEARAIEADDLNEACLHWLGWLLQTAKSIDSKKVAIIREGAESYLHALGLYETAVQSSRRGPPRIPWYEEDVVLPVQSDDDESDRFRAVFEGGAR